MECRAKILINQIRRKWIIWSIIVALDFMFVIVSVWTKNLEFMSYGSFFAVLSLIWIWKIALSKEDL